MWSLASLPEKRVVYICSMKHRINLLSKKEKTVFDKTVYFFLNYLRYVLVITQLVVLGVLFFRFRIDESIIELRDSVKQKQEILQVVKPLLENATKVKAQLDTVDSAIQKQEKQQKMLEYVFLAFPQELYVERALITEQSMDLEGTTQNPTQFQKYYLYLQEDKQFQEVRIESLQKKDNAYKFKLILTGYEPS